VSNEPPNSEKPLNSEPLPTESPSATDSPTDPVDLDRRRLENLLARIRKHEILIAVVESCTGGDLAARITDVPGASDFFWGGWITYQTPSKTQLLGVSAELIAESYVVSAEVASSMARQGASTLTKIAGDSLKAYRGLMVVSTTGVTGPGPLRPDKLAGLCYLGIAHQKRDLDESGRPLESWGPLLVSSRKIFSPAPRTRMQNKSYFCDEALTLIEDKLHHFEPEEKDD
jgi:nicotinamide-nucleotide amidase